MNHPMCRSENGYKIRMKVFRNATITLCMPGYFAYVLVVCPFFLRNYLFDIEFFAKKWFWKRKAWKISQGKNTAPWEIFHAFLSSIDFFSADFCRLRSTFHFEKFFQEYYLSVKQIGSRSGQMAWSRSKQFAKVISRRHQEIKSKGKNVLQRHSIFIVNVTSWRSQIIGKNIFFVFFKWIDLITWNC